MQDQSKARARQARYRESHREQTRAAVARSAAKYREAYLLVDAAYRERNRETLRAAAIEYQRGRPDQRRANVRNRRARLRKADGSHSAVDVLRQHAAQQGRCYWCHVDVGHSYHVDHVVPLSRGGSNDPENLVISCPPCNRAKSDRLPHEWTQGNRLL